MRSERVVSMRIEHVVIVVVVVGVVIVVIVVVSERACY